MPTITGNISGNTSSPELIEPHEYSQESNHIVHDVPGASDLWVTFGDAGSRQGSFSALYKTETDAEAARVLLTGPETFALTYPDRDTFEFNFVVTGSVTVQLLRNRRWWMVRTEYREVT